jgi:hypothetical protein
VVEDAEDLELADGGAGGDEAAGRRGAAVEADGRGLEAELALWFADEPGRHGGRVEAAVLLRDGGGHVSGSPR